MRRWTNANPARLSGSRSWSHTKTLNRGFCLPNPLPQLPIPYSFPLVSQGSEQGWELLGAQTPPGPPSLHATLQVRSIASHTHSEGPNHSPYHHTRHHSHFSYLLPGTLRPQSLLGAFPDSPKEAQPCLVLWCSGKTQRPCFPWGIASIPGRSSGGAASRPVHRIEDPRRGPQTRAPCWGEPCPGYAHGSPSLSTHILVCDVGVETPALGSVSGPRKRMDAKVTALSC